MTNMNRFSGLKHAFIFQQNSTINLKVQKHKRYDVVNCTVIPSNLAKNLYSVGLTKIYRKSSLTFFFATTTAIAFNNNYIVNKQENLVQKLAELTNNLAK